MKKYMSLVILLLITLISSTTFASTTTKFEIVEDNVATITIGEYLEFEKRMVSYDIEARQVTIQLQVTNNAIAEKPTGEVVLLLDTSASTTENASDEYTRTELIYNSAKELIEKMLTDNDQLQVGVARFSTYANSATDAGDETFEGTKADASVVSELTSEISSLQNAIDNTLNNLNNYGARTNLQAGIQVAKDIFDESSNDKKYLIILTDGIPNIAIYDTETSSENNGYYSDYVINATKIELESLQTDNIEVITMLTGISEEYNDQTPTGSSYTYSQLISQIFGTEETPTAGTFYNIQENENIENTIVNRIYNDLIDNSDDLTLNNITVTDYFPQYIVDNFDFAYISSPNIGSISATIDTETNCIIWNIDGLEAGETATVQYTLTLKENYSSTIVGEILDTNESVEVTYNDQTETSEETPKVRITELTGEDPTTANTILPNAGLPILIAIGGVALAFFAFSSIKLYLIHRKMK